MVVSSIRLRRAWSSPSLLVACDFRVNVARWVLGVPAVSRRSFQCHFMEKKCDSLHSLPGAQPVCSKKDSVISITHNRGSRDRKAREISSISTLPTSSLLLRTTASSSFAHTFTLASNTTRHSFWTRQYRTLVLRHRKAPLLLPLIIIAHPSTHTSKLTSPLSLGRLAIELPASTASTASVAHKATTTTQ